MQKKKLNIILILVVLGLWGTVIYKSLNRFFTSEVSDFANTNSSQSFDLKKISKDTFLLEKLNRDPFLDKALALKTNPSIEKKIKPVIKPKVNPKPKPVEVVKSVIWPQVSYYGYIKSKEKSEELILVKIDNGFLKLRKNQNIEGLIIKRIFKDSIEVCFNKEKKFIYKNSK